MGMGNRRYCESCYVAFAMSFSAYCSGCDWRRVLIEEKTDFEREKPEPEDAGYEPED